MKLRASVTWAFSASEWSAWGTTVRCTLTGWLESIAYLSGYEEKYRALLGSHIADEVTLTHSEFYE